MRLSILSLGLAAALIWMNPVAAGPVLEEVRRIPLEGDLSGAADLRVEDGEVLYISARSFGVARVPLADTGLGEPKLLVSENRATGVAMAEHLGLGTEHLAVAGPFSQLLWVERKTGGSSGQLGTMGAPDQAPISFFEDVDLHGDTLAILGLMRSETGMSPDGAIAWLGEFGESGVDLDPLAFAKSGKGARPFDACATFAIGKVRFLADGNLFLLPGAEPGAFLYSRDGELIRAWDTAPLGLGLRCDFDDDTMLRFGSDVEARLDYVNRFVTVDEVLPTPDGPGLLLRATDRDGTSWRLVILHEDGTSEELSVPIESDSRQAHLRGDVYGDRVFLVLRYFFSRGEERDGAELIELAFDHRGDARSDSDKDGR